MSIIDVPDVLAKEFEKEHGSMSWGPWEMATWLAKKLIAERKAHAVTAKQFVDADSYAKCLEIKQPVVMQDAYESGWNNRRVYQG
jgi:hypothetical protein